MCWSPEGQGELVVDGEAEVEGLGRQDGRGRSLGRGLRQAEWSWAELGSRA